MKELEAKKMRKCCFWVEKGFFESLDSFLFFNILLLTFYAVSQCLAGAFYVRRRRLVIQFVIQLLNRLLNRLINLVAPLG